LNPSKGNATAKMDIVFMRNVLIYFNVKTKKAVFAKVKRVLKRNGYLFLGGAETTMGIDDAVKKVTLDEGSCYQPGGA
jgi:chemotaxis protein methyltransferase CheR